MTHSDWYMPGSTGFFIRELQLLHTFLLRSDEEFDHLPGASPTFGVWGDHRFQRLVEIVSPIPVQYHGNETVPKWCKPVENLRQDLGSILLACGIQVPHGFISLYGESLAPYREWLESFISDSRRTLFIIVSGLKPESDEGGSDQEARRREGERQTFPFEEIARCLKKVQDRFGNINIQPIAVQYGDPNAIQELLNKVSEDAGLTNGIHLPTTVDWYNDFVAQAAFMAAVCEFNRSQGFPPLSVGNAATYAHMLLALEQWYSCGGKAFVAHDSFTGGKREENRSYWRDLSDRRIAGVTVLSQPTDNRGEWETVTDQIGSLLVREISSHI
jgi:hypothetical protein